MKEDILEQIAEDWLLSKPSSFTRSNIRYKPNEQLSDYIKKEDSNYSDIDILAIHLNETGAKRVSAISCKSWQGGFDPEYWTKLLSDPEKQKQIINGRECWKFFRELVKPKWTKAFVEKIKSETLSDDFTYYVAVTSIITGKDKKIFEECNYFINNFKEQGAKDIRIIVIPFSDMFTSFFERNSKHTLEPTLVGRLLQVIKSSNLTENDLKKIFDSADIEIFSEEKPLVKIKKDTTKYIFNGKQLGKGKLVLSVIQDYVKKYPETTFKLLEDVFPHRLQGTETFTQKDKALQKSRPRNFTKSQQIIELKDSQIAVSSQWGIFNIKGFIYHCRNKLNIEIEEKI